MNKKISLKEEVQQNTDKAWNTLYSRLEHNGMLAAEDASPTGRRISPAWRWAAAIGLLLLGAASVYYGRVTGSASGDVLVLHNDMGAPTLVTTLEDGSIVYLSDHTSIEYPQHFADNKREVFLKGDAFFEISSNRDRPFVVDTESVTVEVLGTAFNVKAKEEKSFSLSVRYGKVKVISKANGASVYVEAGKTALLRPDGLQTMLTEDYFQFEKYLRRVHFKDQCLADVVRIINENAETVQLHIAPELGDKRFTATFLDNPPDVMAMLICEMLNLHYSRQQDVIYITSPQ